MKRVLRKFDFRLLVLVSSMVALSLGLVAAQSGAQNVVLYASEATVKVGNWQVVSDSTAAGGARIANPNAGAAKRTTALANPTDYFEMSFSAQSGTAYRLWMRGKAESNSPYNDSVFVQFSGSVNSSGTPVYRIGTTAAAEYNLEDCSGCSVQSWGWQDNGWGVGVMGPLLYFQTTGTQTVRIQVREDGLSIDQIVLSPDAYLNGSPGLLMNDTTIIPKVTATPPPPPPPPPPSSASTIVIWALNVPSGSLIGDWYKDYDGTAAGETILRNPDRGAATISAPSASPKNYVDIPISVVAGIPYHLWLRGKAQSNSTNNDSVYVQFSGSVDSNQAAIYRIGTTNGATIHLEDASGNGLSGWGWSDNGYGATVLGEPVYFQTTGQQTIRVQVREDGMCLDQIILSPSTYLNSSPGASRNDNTIVPISGSPPPPPSNLPPQVTISATPTSGTAPLAVNFTSGASDADGYIVSYSWTFGDGNTSSQPFPTNIYSGAGSYTARLTVTDNLGATASVTTTITANSPAPPPSSTQLKVLSWNGSFAKGTDNIYNIDRTATYVANLNVGIVGLCEIPSTIAVTLRDLVSQKTGQTWYYYHVAKYSGTTEGNLILSRYPIISASARYMSYQRSVAQVTVNVGGRTINFFATHLDPDSSGARATQVSELKSFASGFAEPRIICGDFNAGPDKSELAGMSTGYYDSWMQAMNLSAATAYPDNPVGMHTRTRRGRIDYIWYSSGTTYLTIRNAQIPDSRDLNNHNVVVYLGTLDDLGVRPSDHNQMVATFDVR